MLSLGGLEGSLVLVGSGGEFTGGGSLGSTSLGISSSSSGGSRCGGRGSSLSVGIGKSRSVEVLGLGSSFGLSLLEAWLIVVVSDTLDTVISCEENGLGVSEEKSSNCEFHF